MRVKLLGLVAGAAGLMAATASSVLAHHSFSSEFDVNSPVTLEGEVIKMEWVNPHSWLHIAVENENGETEEWMVEGGAPSALLRRGWSRDSLPPGTKIVVEGYQAHDGDLRANAREITFPDGTSMSLGSRGRGAPPDE